MTDQEQCLLYNRILHLQKFVDFKISPPFSFTSVNEVKGNFFFFETIFHYIVYLFDGASVVNLKIVLR